MSKEAFNGVVMTRAAYLDPAHDGTRVPVTLRDYDPGIHKGKLRCHFCDAQVHHNAGARSKDADNGIQAPHFHTNPGQTHGTDCTYGRILEDNAAQDDEDAGDEKEYDKDAGFRFNLNMDVISGVPHRVHEKLRHHETPHLWPDSLYPMKPVPIQQAADFAKVFLQSELKRIQKSFALWHSHVIPWADFFIRGRERFTDLIDKLRNGQQQRQPVMLYVHPQPQMAFGWDKSSSGKREIACLPVEHSALGNINVKLSLHPACPTMPPDRPLLVICRPEFLRASKTLHINVYDAKNIAACDIRHILAVRPDAPALSPARPG